MRINLNFKDANIRKISRSEFLIEFNLSKMIKPRLTTDARMYIEHFNLGEFIDETFGRNNGNLYGYFELRCDNIDSNDFDSEYGNTGNTIIYTSPLNNFKTFTNNDPMFISNFKISQNFLRDKLVFALNIFDKNGDPFDTSNETEELIDTTTPSHTIYKTKTDALNTLNFNLETAKTILNTTQESINTEKIKESYIRNVLQEKQKKLFDKMNPIINNSHGAVANKIKIEVLKNQLKTHSINDFIYIFEHFIPLHVKIYPYSAIKYELNEFYDAFVSLIYYDFEIRQLTINEHNIDSNATNICYESTSVFDPDSINIKQSPKTSIAYHVVVPNGTNKTGTIDIENFSSSSHNTTTVIIDNIVPTVGTDNELVINDTLIVDKSNFEDITIKKYDYYFYKPYATSILGVTTPGKSTQSRFSLVVSRDGDAYTYNFTNDIPTKGLDPHDTIKIIGSLLGGEDGTNDLTITVNTVYVPATSKQYPFVGLIDLDHTDNGLFNINIERDNSALDYNVISSDFSKTKNYNVGEVIRIPGTALDGDTNSNDAILTVTDVYTAENHYNLDDTEITHSIPPTVISSYNSAVFRIDTSDPTNPIEANVTNGLDYEITISSDDGIYKVVSSIVSSIGFEVGDIIKIIGSKLTGEDGINDLELKITTITADNRIDDVVIEPIGTYTSRKPSSFEFKISQKINDPTYEVEFVSGTGFQIGDILTIDGSEIGGATGTNNLIITVHEVELGFVKTSFHFGRSHHEVGEVGQIHLVAISGTPKLDEADGSWLQSDTGSAGTGVVISGLPVPDLEITISNILANGVKKIESDINAKYTEVLTAKGNLIKSKNVYVLSLDNLLNKLKCINCSLVLYDEVPSYNEVSKDTLCGNTYSRYTGCAFKRI